MDLLLASLTLDIPNLWPMTKVSYVVRKVLRLGECYVGARVLEREKIVHRESGTCWF